VEWRTKEFDLIKNHQTNDANFFRIGLENYHLALMAKSRPDLEILIVVGFMS
jgi:hypothetical protein